MIMVDSSIWINYFNGTISNETDWLDKALGVEPIVMGDIILSEVLQGFQNEKDFKTAKKLLLECPFMDMIGQEVAIKSAMNYRSLRQKGIIIRKTKDVLIGTFCINNNFFLLHDDRDFDPLEKHLKLKVMKI
ncbi:ribonuclease VapC11 [bacterium BMS3Bbin09]|nr:ribonuclease VapC11 [bacterium BMS3Bbin09]